jgi:hypothetical protein
MKGSIDLKSAAVGGVLGALLCLLAGVAGDGARETVGRFRIACENNRAHLVDTVTGQVWRSTDRGFTSPKLTHRPVVTAAEAGQYLGSWREQDTGGDDLTIRLDEGGRAYATEGDAQHHEGSWRVEGGRLFVTIDGERVLGELASDGRLYLWKEGKDDDRKLFRKVQ